MLVGVAAGLLGGITATKLVHAPLRPDVVIAFVVGVPSVFGLVLILFSHRRWMTALGAFILAIAPVNVGVNGAVGSVFGSASPLVDPG